MSAYCITLLMACFACTVDTPCMDVISYLKYSHMLLRQSRRLQHARLTSFRVFTYASMLLLLQRREGGSGHAGAERCSTRRASSRACTPVPGLPAGLQIGASMLTKR